MNFADVAQSPAQPAKENEAFLAFQLTLSINRNHAKIRAIIGFLRKVNLIHAVAC
ncbi:Uncharacterized protein APZ42_001073 [Daphnia magna]|uniref:Uncharacterized protein n=1 Tax=Daphnia magna TaxID=35525 RepID=A0A164J6T8_9CRUS|nr:Uncharacterized protein APZ42_001073 [Daphnia magna]